jgi:hypothetical protein
MTRHTQRQIDDAARRLGKWADELDPEIAQVEDLRDRLSADEREGLTIDLDQLKSELGLH